MLEITIYAFFAAAVFLFLFSIVSGFYAAKFLRSSKGTKKKRNRWRDLRKRVEKLEVAYKEMKQQSNKGIS